MTETQTLLSKIAALRQRLEQAQGLVRDADTAAVALLEKGDQVGQLRAKVEASARQQSLLETELRQLSSHGELGNDGASLPTQLTARAARLLRRAHDLLGQLRSIADKALPAGDNGDPLAQLYRETASMTDAVLRTVQAFPTAPTVQMRLCEGLEAVLSIVAERIFSISLTLQQRQNEAARCNALADLLAGLAAGHIVECKGLTTLAESVHEEVLEALPLRFPDIAADDVPRHIAAHSLTVARVVARLTRQDALWRDKPLEPIMAALVHDVGMLRMPASLLTQKEPLTDEQRRLIETHPILGADMASRITPSSPRLVEAAGQHHERLDGSGYPAGFREMQVMPIIRLLSACDVYAAMCQPRAYRAAFDTRTALTDTLLLAEKGKFDPNYAERLLQLSFYPLGTVVELSDGAVALVVATHQGRRNLNAHARPIVAILADAAGQLLPMPRHVDLLEVEEQTVLRGLPADERRERLGNRYPDLI